MRGRQPDGLAPPAEQSCTTHGLQDSLRHCVRVPPRLAVAHRQHLNDLAQERRQHPLMPQVLTPRLELLGALAWALAVLGKRGPETVGIEGALRRRRGRSRS